MKQKSDPFFIYHFQNEQLNKARQHSKYVRIMRTICISLSCIVGMSLSIALLIDTREVTFLPPIPKVFSAKMVNPRFSGRDSSGKPFIVTAKEATQLPGSNNVFELKEPILTFNLKKNFFSKVKSKQGLYDQVADLLELYDQVKFNTDEGYAFQTEKASFMIKENRIEGSLPVTGEGPKGHISAQSFTIDQNWNRYIFKGKVKTIIDENQTKTLE